MQACTRVGRGSRGSFASLLAVVFAAVGVATTVALSAGVAHAADFPDKPIRIIVPYPAGGATDQMARVIQPAMTEFLKQPVIIDNRPGAGGVIGMQAVVGAAPDGYTLMFGNTGPNSVLPLMRKLPFDPSRDLRSVSLVALSPLILAVPADSKAHTLAEFLALARQSGSSLNYGSVGNGSISHLTGEYFKFLTNTRMVHVPYKGGAPLMTAFGTGDIQLAFVTGIDAASMHKAGKLRYLGVATEKPTAVVPGLPAVAEQVPGFTGVAWFGVLAPAGTPDVIVDQLRAAIVQAVARPEVRDYFAERNIEAHSSNAAEFDKLMRDEIKVWGEVVQRANIQE